MQTERFFPSSPLFPPRISVRAGRVCELRQSQRIDDATTRAPKTVGESVHWENGSPFIAWMPKGHDAPFGEGSSMSSPRRVVVSAAPGRGPAGSLGEFAPPFRNFVRGTDSATPREPMCREFVVLRELVKEGQVKKLPRRA